MMPISLTMLGNTFAEALLAALKPESTRIAASKAIVYTCNS